MKFSTYLHRRVFVMGATLFALNTVLSLQQRNKKKKGKKKKESTHTPSVGMDVYGELSLKSLLVIMGFKSLTSED